MSLEQIETIHNQTSSSNIQENNGNNDRKERKKHMKIQFTDIHIRLYNRILGDNPAVSDGPPIQLSWEYTEKEPQSVDEYETNRLPRRPKHHLSLSNTRRNQIMQLHFEYSQEEIDKATNSVKKTQKQRELSKMITPTVEKRQEIAQKVTRTIKRTFSREKLWLQQNWNSMEYDGSKQQEYPGIMIKSC
jgi:hypothetical protein